MVVSLVPQMGFRSRAPQARRVWVHSMIEFMVLEVGVEPTCPVKGAGF